MSADNGIYILETEGPEYRVAHLSAVENYLWDEEIKEMDYGNMDNAIKNAREMWHDQTVHLDKASALAEAAKMEEEIYADDYCPILEYGISFIRIPRRF